MATKTICDICGAEMKEDAFRVRRYGVGEDDMRGYFGINYYRAVKKADGTLRNYQYEPGTAICEECRKVANRAIWEALSPRITEGSAVTTDLKPAGFDPIAEEEAR